MNKKTIMITVLAEKPSVAKDIATYLGATNKKNGYFEGNNYRVTWAYGHLVQIKDLKELGYTEKWCLSNLPFIPNNLELKVKDDNGAKAQFTIIKELFNTSSSIICATDAGREGELIFRYIYQLSKCKIPFERLWISSLTEASIKEGFLNLKSSKQYDNLFYSAKARNEADYIVGINATIGMTAKANSLGLLSLGRVQTPTLALICQRFIENRDFTPQPYFVVELLLYALNKGEFKSFFETSFENKEDADNLINSLGVSLIVSDIVSTDVKEAAPTLFDLTLLQREANQKFGYTAQETLSIAQSLYEKHKVLSYPRTASKFLSDDLIPKIPQLLKNIATYHSKIDLILSLLEKPLSKRPINNEKVTDHHAIIPTEIEPNFSNFTNEEANIYNLVVIRFIEAFMPECIKASTKVTFETEKGNFISKGTVIKVLGWREVRTEIEPITEDLENLNQKIPFLKIGENVSILTKKTLSKFTTPLPIYTESSLLQIMETAGKLIDDEALADAMKEGGLGTPATRASIIEVLVHRQFIYRDKKKILPSDLGLKLYELVKDLSISKAELTGAWEYKLAMIEKGAYNIEEFTTEIKHYTSSIIASIKDMNVAAMNKVIAKCNSCSDGNIMELGNAYKCSNIDDERCNLPIIWKKIGGKNITDENVKDLVNSGRTQILKGFKNKEGVSFDAALIIDKENNKIKYDFTKHTIGECPKCKTGKVEKGSKFYKCNNKDCDFIVFNIIGGKSIIESNVTKIIKEGRSPLIKGFISKANKTFDAYLVLNEEFKVNYEFLKK